VLAAGQKTFEDVVVYSNQLTVVVFYSPSCPHCTRLEPEVKDAAKRLAAEGVKVVAVDAVAERGLADYYNVTGYPFVYVFVPPEKATSHAGGEAEPVGVTGIGGEGRIVQAACEQKQLLVERSLRNRPAGGSKILPELESYDDVRAVVTLDHPTTLSAKAAVLYLAGSGGDSSGSVCGLDSAETVPDWLTSVATRFKEGRAKAVSFGAVPASLATAGLAEELGLAPAQLPALIFVRAKARRGRPAGVSTFGGSLKIDAKQKKTALIKAARAFVEKAVRGELPDSASPHSVPSSLKPAPGSETEDTEVDEAQLQREKVAAWLPTEIDSSETLRSSCYESAGVCLMLLCSIDSDSASSSSGVAAAAVCDPPPAPWAIAAATPWAIAAAKASC
jgi:thiol-disulfide isomerase/thioredoxin